MPLHSLNLTRREDRRSYASYLFPLLTTTKIDLKARRLTTSTARRESSYLRSPQGVNRGKRSPYKGVVLLGLLGIRRKILLSLRGILSKKKRLATKEEKRAYFLHLLQEVVPILMRIEKVAFKAFS